MIVVKCSFIILILSISNVLSAGFITEQPSYLPPCQINNPEFVKCSTKSIQSLFHQLKSGIPGLKTLDKVDPFFINKIHFDQNNNNIVNLKADISKVVVTGFGDTMVKQSKVSKKDYSWETKFRIPLLTIAGNYVMDGRVLLVPLQGKGKMFLRAENCDITMYTTTTLYEKGGFTFYNVTNVKVDLDISGLKSNFENLFNGNRQLGDSVNVFFNENWKDFFEAMRPVVRETIEEILLSVLQRVFHYIPANFLVTDIPTSKQLYGS